MKIKYEATFFDASKRYHREDYETVEEAIAAVETAGSGNVTKFREYPNRPGCLPEFESQSLALWSFEREEWRKISIFGGVGQSLGKGKPA